ncbi:histidine phosphotransferase [Rhodobacteraceae bacterium 63075]|nr:histidine phosphotransferase [Rhodobacteraceae bacterium 63075]
MLDCTWPMPQSGWPGWRTRIPGVRMAFRSLMRQPIQERPAMTQAMTQDMLTLARLVGSRICHDIISPVGAISNGMELIELTGTAGSPEMSLISDSVAGANARIRFYRIALGLASSEQMIGPSEITGILSAFYRDTRLDCAWQAEGDVPRDEAQAVFLALLCAAAALPSGGQLDVAREGPGWRITGAADTMRLHAPLWDMLAGAGNPSVQPSEVQFAMLPVCTAALGRNLGYETDDTSVKIRF